MPEKTNSAKTNSMKLRNGKKYEIQKKRISSDDDDNSSSWIDDTCDEEEEELDMKEFRGMLSSLFPSKYIVEKAKNTPSSKDNKDKNSSKKEGETISKKNVKKYKKIESSSEEYSDNQIEDETEEDEDYEDEDDDEYVTKKNGLGKINIIFTMGGNKNDMYDDDEYYDEEDDEDYEDEDEEDETTEEESEDIENTDDETDDDDVADENKNETKMSDKEIMTTFKEMIKSVNKNNPIVKKFSKLTKEIEEKERRKQQKIDNQKKKKNVNKFKQLLKSGNSMNDLTFFKQKLTFEEQQKVLKEMETVHNLTKIEKPYRLTVLESDIPTRFKSCALRRLNQLRYMEPGSGEYYKIKNWIDTFMQIPFGKYNNLPITLSDGVDKCHDFMDDAKNCLDKEVFGLNDAKMQIMQMVGQWIANPDAVGTAIAIQGPMGTGKTTLVKDGISKILNREFAFIALGGATDSSFLEGHSYTYEGSTWGKIVDILIHCKSMNPIIYFDELDKVSDTPKGEEIIGILTHLTDTSQNTKFHDKYFSEIDFDLSKCLFIFSYNDESKVNPILKDRMYRIHTTGYNKPEKASIAKDYLLPKIIDQVKFEKEQINIPDETLHYIIDNFTHEENGVRNLKRCLEIVYTKLNLYRLMKPGTNLFEQDMSLNIEFPLNVTIDIVNKLLKKDNKSSVPYGMYT